MKLLKLDILSPFKKIKSNSINLYLLIGKVEVKR